MRRDAYDNNEFTLASLKTTPRITYTTFYVYVISDLISRTERIGYANLAK